MPLSSNQEEDEGDPFLISMDILRSTLVVAAMVTAVMSCICIKFIIQTMKAKEPRMANKLKLSLPFNQTTRVSQVA